MPNLTSDKKLALTQAELAYLKSFLDAGDRPGFYYAYYAMVSEDTSYGQAASDIGKDEASLQAKISSFSEPVGAAAYYSNRILQEKLGAGYEGIYNLSQKVAGSAYAAIVKSVTDDKTGLISDVEFFQSAQQAWDDAGVPKIFPGLLLDGLSKFSLATRSVGHAIGLLAEFGARALGLSGDPAVSS